jgi:hypothetical protein
MKRISKVVLISLLALGACGQSNVSGAQSDVKAEIVKSERSSDNSNPSPSDAAIAAMNVEAVTVASGSAPPPPPPTGEPPLPNSPNSAPTTTTALLLAYSYIASFSLPADNVTKAMKSHEARCVTAGPALCQVVSASSQKEGDNVSASLNLRATPVWLGSFRAGLENDAKTADGKLEGQAVNSEDLTRSITDSEARLRALKSLRTRVEALIADRPGKLSDLLEAERELARVQGEIDSFESNLSVMRARVTMSSMELRYQSRQVAVGGGTFEPLANSITGFFAVMARSLASIITLLAAILPFGLVLVPIGYYGLKWRTKQLSKRQAQRNTSNASTIPPLGD